jgi:hypothetical protein
MHRAFKQLLDQHYELQDRFDVLQKSQAMPSASAPAGPPPGSGPTDTQLLGLFVKPVDTHTLADGVKLTWVRKNGRFEFL